VFLFFFLCCFLPMCLCIFVPANFFPVPLPFIESDAVANAALRDSTPRSMGMDRDFKWCTSGGSPGPSMPGKRQKLSGKANLRISSPSAESVIIGNFALPIAEWTDHRKSGPEQSASSCPRRFVVKWMGSFLQYHQSRDPKSSSGADDRSDIARILKGDKQRAPLEDESASHAGKEGTRTIRTGWLVPKASTSLKSSADRE